MIRIVGDLMAVDVVGDEITGRLFLGLVGAGLEQRVLGDLFRDVAVELQVAELEQLDRLGELGRQQQLLRLANA